MTIARHILAPALAYLLLIAGGSGVDGLRGVGVRVPEAVGAGGAAELGCRFDLQGDPLYTVKWYKGGREFFRFTPKEDPTIKVFPTHGLSPTTIDIESSNATLVYVRTATPSMTGLYSCEVSADAPSFHTALVSAPMRVVQLPRGRPRVFGLRARYPLGGTLFGNCSSPPSRPAANLTWTISGRKVNKEHVMNYISLSSDDQEIASVTLQMPLTPLKFTEGRYRISCTATLYNLYQETTEWHTEITSPESSRNEIFDEYD